MARRTRRAALLTLAMINVFTLAAGIAVARMLPARLAALRVPTVAAGALAAGDPVLTNRNGPLPTTTGLRSALAGPLSATALGAQVSALVADPFTGRVLLSEHGTRAMTPASTTKLATALAALAVLGADARFTTTVVRGPAPDSIVLVGGGDPTLAVHPFPAGAYPQPATLAGLAKATAHALIAQGRRSVVLGYDTSLYTGPGLAPGWPAAYISAGDVTPIVSLEVDQGRLTASGQPEDSDDPYNLQPRSTDPAAMAVSAFAALLTADGVHVTGIPRAQRAAARTALASVTSPPLAAIVAQMLEESNNVIAENLARQVAVAAGQPASFSGAAQAEIGELKKLGVTIRPPSGRRQRPVTPGRDRAGHAGEGPGTGRRPPAVPAAAGRPAGGRLLRHAVGRGERVQRDRRPRPGLGTGQDRQPGHGGVAGRTGL